MIKISFITLVFVSAMLFVGLMINGTFNGWANAQTQPVCTPENLTDCNQPTCPEGTTPTGGGGCKIIPTGCPWGDSVPLDKCEAPEVNQPTTPPIPSTPENGALK